MKRYRTLLVISTTLISACGGSPSRQQVTDFREGTTAPPPVPVVDTKAHAQAAFATLAQTCFAVGGVFDELDRSCACPTSATGVPQSFQALYRNDPAAEGLKKRVFDRYACTEQYRLAPQRGVASFREVLSGGRDQLVKDLAEVRNIGNGRSLVFELDPAMPEAELQALVQYLDENPPYINIPSGNQWREMYRIKLFKPDDGLDRVKRIPYFDFEDTSLIERYGNEMYVWSLDDFAHLSATAPVADLALPQLPLVNNPSLPALMDGLRAWQNFLQKKQALEVKEEVVVADQGCHVLCDYKASFAWNGRYYWYEKNYARGAVFRQAFYLGHEDGTLDAMTLLFPDRRPSVFVTEQRSLGADGRFEVDSNALDSNGDLVRFTQYPPIEDPQAFAGKLQKLRTFHPNAPETTVLVLEESTQLEEPWELDYWIRGPHAADRPTPQKSLYGWIQPDQSGDNAFSFYFGAMDLNWATDAAHGREVLHDLMQGIRPGEAYGISTDFTWLLEGQRFNQLVEQSKARIATISAILSVEEAECQRLTANLNADILWIAGAGNEAKENPRFRCPQKIQRKDLKIVAAAGGRDGLAFFAEYGRDYADIAADPISYIGRRGSSYSAPKVANVALKIVKRFGAVLTNKEVRLAILLGSDVNVAQRLPVRTGGALSEAFALQAAAAITKLSSSTRAQLLDRASDRAPLFAQIIRASGALSEADAQDQARYLVQNGL